MTKELEAQHYNELKHDMNGLKQSFNNVQKSLQRIETCLMSDDELGRVGLVEKVQKISLKVDEIDSIVKNIQRVEEISAAKKGVWMVIFGGIGGVIIWMIEHLFQWMQK